MAKKQTDKNRAPVFAGSKYATSKKGWVDFPSGKRFFMRSSWEEKYGMYIDGLLSKKKIADWDYEADTFWFEKIKRGVQSYTPDFRITNLDGSIEYHETKGWLDAKSKTKMNRMRIYHPTVTVKLIMRKEMKELGLL